MSGSTKQAPKGVRPHLSSEHVGRQLRAAFDPVPTGIDDFADLLSQLESAEAPPQPVPAE